MLRHGEIRILPTSSAVRGLAVFLHGDFGNVLTLPQRAWAAFADRHGVAFACPSHRWGFWNARSVPVIAASADRLRRDYPDAGPPLLLGHSDGGLGVLHAVAADPAAWGGLVFLSATTTEYAGLPFLSSTRTHRLIAHPPDPRAWRDRPILILQGDRDPSVRKADVDRSATALIDQGARVDYRVYAGAGHLLFPFQKERVFADLADWLGHK